ncbi:hypothetical protein KJ877_08360 [bacterium]|nr:hypothetical protein [bacterium]MBU1990228.1 hypothetical protein [bacterium]
MSTYTLVYLNRNEYLSSIKDIKDSGTLNFANMSLQWWDKQFGWYIKGCVVLRDQDNTHLSYLFYKIDRYNEYMTIHNIFTPHARRRHGYANILLGMIFDLAVIEKVSRFKFSSISNSLDFYLSLGFVYWGLNSVGDYYCDLPVPKNGLSGLKKMLQEENIATLIGKKLHKIYTKIENNDTSLTLEQTDKYNQDKTKMGAKYLLSALSKIKHES